MVRPAEASCQGKDLTKGVEMQRGHLLLCRGNYRAAAADGIVPQVPQDRQCVRLSLERCCYSFPKSTAFEQTNSAVYLSLPFCLSTPVSVWVGGRACV